MSDQRTNAPHWVAPDLGPRPAAIEFVVFEDPVRWELTVHRGMAWMGGTVWLVEFKGPVPVYYKGKWFLCNLGNAWVGDPDGTFQQLTVVLEDPQGSGR